MTRRPRRAAAVAAIVLSVSGLSACGFDMATDKVIADNAAGSTPQGSVFAQALVLVKSPNAVAAALAGSIFNDGTTPDTLETITLTPDGVSGVQPIVLRPNLALGPRSVIQWGAPGHEPLTVPNAQNLKLGHFVDVLLHFKNAGDIKVQVETHKREGFYSDVLPTVGQNEQADRRLAPCTFTPVGGKPRACRTQAEFDRAAKAAAAKSGTTGTSTTPTEEKAGTNPGDTGTASSGDGLTGSDGAAVTKSSVTKAPSAAATRAAKRAAKRAAAAKAKAAGAAGTTTKAPAAPAAPAPAAPAAPVAPAEPAAEHGADDPHGGGH